MSRWDARQQAMLAALGLGAEWGGQGGLALDADQAPAPAEPIKAPASPAAPRPRPVIRDAAPEQGLPVAEPERAPAPVAAPASWSDLDSLHAAVRDCRACGLCQGRRQAVPGIGHAQAQWMVVGEAPGEQEDLRGEPFVGPSGQLLDAMLAAVGRTRHTDSAERQVYIANSVKCRPPSNRNPSSEELLACAPFLKAQLALVKPRVVLALGRFAVQSLLGSETPIGRLRGQVHRLPDGTPVVVSYHPAYLLRQPQEKAKAWEDLCLAAAVAAERSA